MHSGFPSASILSKSHSFSVASFAPEEFTNVDGMCKSSSIHLYVSLLLSDKRNREARSFETLTSSCERWSIPLPMVSRMFVFLNYCKNREEFPT